MSIGKITGTVTSPPKPILDKFLGSYVGCITDAYRNLVFSKSGLTRLFHTAGFFRGLCACGRKDLAEKMAADFSDKLQYLNDYGGMVHCGEEKAPSDLMVPRSKVMLHDDGTFGGFGICWYSFMSNPTLHERAKVHQEQNPGMEWKDALQAIKEKHRIEEKLAFTRYYYPTWDTKREHMQPSWNHYGFWFNGGLLYHGPGGDEVFSVVIGDVKYWSIHT